MVAFDDVGVFEPELGFVLFFFVFGWGWFSFYPAGDEEGVVEEFFG